jgi:hypothetical protein
MEHPLFGQKQYWPQHNITLDQRIQKERLQTYGALSEGSG